MSHPFPFSEESAGARLARVFEAAECRTQMELAVVLDIRQSSISDAKRRGVIPPDWLIKLFQSRGVNPNWVLQGTGPKFLTSGIAHGTANYLHENFPPVRAFDAAIVRNILSCFPAGDLESELRRRRRKTAPESPPQTTAKRKGGE